jgi:hypothetical protein
VLLALAITNRRIPKMKKGIGTRLLRTKRERKTTEDKQKPKLTNLLMSYAF